MKYVLLALAVLATACSAGRDRYEPHFGARTTMVETNGPVVIAVGGRPGMTGDVFYAELRTNRVMLADDPPRHLFDLPHKPDSLAVDREARVYAATRTKKHRLRIYRDDQLISEGPVSRFPAHLAITEKGEVILGLGDAVVQLEPRREISDGWTDPVVTPGRGNRIWVADNGLPGGKERVARGREQRVAKRNRFASTLPEYTNPSGMALRDDELLLCSRTHKKVYRLHIGIDDVARWRGQVGELVCDRDIAVLRNGGLVTATSGAIYYYPPA